MLKFFMKHRGSVSIMMAIILLPTMALSALLVDLANRNLSKAMVESAGDLAASSALANYDSVLADVYGLFAVSQTEKDLKENLTQYFTDTLSAANLLENSNMALRYATGLVDAIDLDTLGSPLVDADVEVTAASGVPNTALNDPKILQGQIIEFMKYRGPVEVGLDLLDMINALKGVNDKAEVAELNTTVQEDVAAVSNVEQQLYNAIVLCDRDLKTVNDYVNKPGYWDNGAYNTAVAFDFSSGTVVPVTQYSISEDSVNYQIYLAMCAIAGVVNFPDIERHLYDSVPKMLMSAERGTEAYQKEYPASQWLLATVRYTDQYSPGSMEQYYKPNTDRTVLRSLADAQSTVAQDIADANVCCAQEYLDRYPNPLRALIDENRYTFSGQEKVAVQLFYSDVAPSAFIEHFMPLFDDLNQVCSEIDRLDAEIAEAEGDEAEALETERSGYQTLKSELEAAIKAVDAVMVGHLAYPAASQIYTDMLFSAYLSAQKHLTKIHDSMAPLYTALESLKTNLASAIELVGTVKTNLATLNSDNAALKTGTEAYAQKNSQDGYYDSMMQTAETVDAQHSAESADELLAQLNAINAYLFGEKGLMGNIEGVKVCDVGNPITEKKLAGGEKTYFALDSGGNRIGFDYAETIKFAADEYASLGYAQSELPNALYFAKVKPLKPLEPMTDSAYTKCVSEALVRDGFSANVPSYYIYLQSTYSYADSSAGSAGNNTAGNASALAGNANSATKADTGLNYTSDVFDSLTKPVVNKNGQTQTAVSGTVGESSAEIEIDSSNTGALKMIKSVFSTTKEMLEVITDPQKLLEGLRDSLLTTEYIYENFSNYMMKVNKDNKTFRTMTNVDVSSANNAIFGCEVEYILYGNRGDDSKGPQKNVDTALNRIFLIRMLCNSVFAMTDQSVQALTIGPALAIQAATLGVFPYKVAQVVLDICLALAESIWDVSEIKGGNEIVLVKTWDTWVMGGAGALKTITGKVTDTVFEGVAEAGKKAIDDLSGKLQSLVDRGVNLAEETITNAGQDIADDVTDVLTSGLEDALSGALSAMTAEVEDIYYSFFRAAEKAAEVDEAFVREKLTDALNGYLETTDLTASVKSFVRKYSGDAVKFVMDRKVTVGGKAVSISSFLQSFGQKIKDVASGKVGSLQFDPEDANSLHEVLAKIPADFVASKIKDLKKQADEWVGDLGDSVQEKLDSGIRELTDKANQKTRELTQEAASGVKSEVNGFIDSYFPQEKAISTDAGETGGASKMLKLGYEDYLRLFLFLGVINSSKRPAILTRIGETVTLNVKNGLADYYAEAGLSGHPAGKSFYLEDAYTYVSVTADVTLDPLLLDKAFIQQGAARIDETTGAVINPMEGRESLWKYSFTALAGY